MSVYEHNKSEQDNKSSTPKDIQEEHENISQIKNFLSGLDHDQLLVLAVLVLMLKNGGNMRLIIALGYIIIGGGKNE